MQLLQCHIDNFGKLSNVDIQFQNGENIFCQDNGWGKSTLAAFIRAMFYGLDGERKKSLLENERKRYKPWQGGVFGGNLTFSVQGKIYQVTRIFKEKESMDEFELRDALTNLISKDYSKEIGKELFGLNRNSFLRSVFIGQLDCPTFATDDIYAQIGNLADHVNDMNCFESADQRLTELRNAMTPRRKTGSLYRKKEKIAELERQIKDGESLEDAMALQRDRYDREKEKLEALEKAKAKNQQLRRKVSRYQDLQAKKEYWEKLSLDLLEKKKKYREAMESFPKGVPDLTELQKTVESCQELERVKERQQIHQMTEEELQREAKLREKFQKHPLEKDKLLEMMEMNRKYLQEQQKISSLQMTKEVLQELTDLEKVFADQKNPEEKIKEHMAGWNTYEMKKAALAARKTALDQMKALSKSTSEKNKKQWLLLLGCIFVFIGAGFFLFMAAAGVITIGIGTVMILGGLLSSHKTTENRSDLLKMQTEIEIEEKEIRQICQKTEAYFSAQGIVWNESQVLAELQRLFQNAGRYKMLKEQKEKLENAKETSKISWYREEIQSFLESYEIFDSYFTEGFYALDQEREQLEVLKIQKKQLEDAKSQSLNLKEKIEGFFTAYGWEVSASPMEQLLNLQKQVQELYHRERDWKQVQKQKEDYEKEHQILEILEKVSQEELVSLQELDIQRNQLEAEEEQRRNYLRNYQIQIEELEKSYEEWQELGYLRKEKQQEYEAEQKKYQRICKAQDYLTKAKESFTARYMGPIKDAFLKYYQMITKEDTASYCLDANLHLTLEAYGKQRETESLSTGYQDLVYLAFRLALIDAMYQKEKPFLILDDPLVNLDQEKTKAAKVFLKEISKKYQILYFTCHESRV